MNGPGSRFLGSDREEGVQTQEGVAFADDTVETGLVETEARQILRPLVGIELRQLGLDGGGDDDTPRPLSAKQVERLNAKSTGTAIKWMSKAQTWLFKATGGKTDADALGAALRKADFQSVRGKFKFNTNQHPIQDWYLLRIEPDASGKLGYRTIKPIAPDHGDPHAKDCRL